MLWTDHRSIHIMHIDDHSLFPECVHKCLEKKFSNLIITGFGESVSALKFLNDCLIAKRKIDFVITDHNPPGPNGLLFAQDVRKLESIYGVRLPLMMLTMITRVDFLTDATNRPIIDFYMTKSRTCEDIIETIRMNIA
jgi:DNA-binding NarL/FixJ family response regulator